MQDDLNKIENRLERIEIKLDNHLERVTKVEQSVEHIRGQIKIFMSLLLTALSAVGTAVYHYIIGK